MAKTLVFDGIETSKLGSVFLRLRKFSSDGDYLGTHHIEFVPGCNISDMMAAVNGNFASDNFAPFTDTSQVEAVAQVIWTPEVIAAYQAAQNAP